jgi:hypothetical protein
MAEMKALLERYEPDLDSVKCLFLRVQDQVTSIEIYRDETECALRNHIMELENFFEDQVSFVQTETKRMKAFQFHGEKAEILENEAEVKNLQLKGEIEVLQSELQQATKSDQCHVLEAKIEVLQLDVSSFKARMNEALQEKERISNLASAHFSRVLCLQQGLSEVQTAMWDGASEIIKIACACKEIALLLQADTVKPPIGEIACSDCESGANSAQKGFSVGIATMGRNEETRTELKSSNPLHIEGLQRTDQQLSDSQGQVQESTLQMQLVDDLLSTEISNSIDGQNLIVAERETRKLASKNVLLEQIESSKRILQKASDSLSARERRCCDLEIQIQDLQQKVYLSTEQEMNIRKHHDSLLAENEALKYTLQTSFNALKRSEAKKGELMALIQVLQLEEGNFKALPEEDRHKAEIQIKALQEIVSRKEAILNESSLRCVLLDSVGNARQTGIEQLQKQCADFYVLIEKKDKELEYLRQDFISSRARALESERSVARESSNLGNKKVVSMRIRLGFE